MYFSLNSRSVLVPLLLAFLFGCRSDRTAPEKIVIETQEVPGISIRAIEVISEDICWFAGSNGCFGYTLDGGLSWSIDSIDEARGFELRSLSVLNDSTVLVLNADMPARIWRTSDRGAHWTKVFEDSSAGVFFDCMQFWDPFQGLAFGDPNQGCFHILITRDGGQSWERIPCSDLPQHQPGEAAFAASNTNIACFGSHAWIATGGHHARVLHSPDHGRSWESFAVPMIQGRDMTGTFSMDVWDDQRAVAIGGNWSEPEDDSDNLMLTEDGGRSWKLIHSDHPGYRSCIQYVPGHRAQWIMAVGYPGMDITDDGGHTWKHLNDERWYSLRFAPTGKKAFLAGPEKLGYFSLP